MPSMPVGVALFIESLGTISFWCLFRLAQVRIGRRYEVVLAVRLAEIIRLSLVVRLQRLLRVYLHFAHHVHHLGFAGFRLPHLGVHRSLPPPHSQTPALDLPKRLFPRP